MLAALALVVFGAIECPPKILTTLCAVGCELAEDESRRVV